MIRHETRAREVRRKVIRMPKKPPLTRSLIGPSGEHFVLSRLYQQGLLAALAPPGTPEVDVLVLSPDGTTIAATIQVKASTGGARSGWQFSAKHEAISRARMFYALVDFRADSPVTYILPSAEVASVLRRSHQGWLATTGRKGQPHRDNEMRQVKAAYSFEVPGCQDGWLDHWREAWGQIADTAS
jgi:hypothetical protein